MIKAATTRVARAARYAGVLAVAIAVGFVGMTQADARNFPHFRSFSVTLVDPVDIGFNALARAASVESTDIPDLLFTWTEVGVGNIDIEYELQSVLSVTFGCVNGGSNQPGASNKTTVTVPVATTTTLSSDKNGRISGSVVLPTPSVSVGEFTCPAGQTLTAISATFAQNTITDTTNGVTATHDDIVVTFQP
jgi:hypothetical protein